MPNHGSLPPGLVDGEIYRNATGTLIERQAISSPQVIVPNSPTPPTPVAGQLYRNSAGILVELEAVQSPRVIIPISAVPPPTPVVGEIYRDTNGNLVERKGSSWVSTESVLPPVGTIVAYAPGYFAAGANGGGWTVIGPATNTVAGVKTFLAGTGWTVCDGTAPNDATSPIFNSAARFLPDLTGAIFIMGNTVAGAVGGNAGNQFTLTATQLPSHNHAVTGAVTAGNAPHTHAETLTTGNSAVLDVTEGSGGNLIRSFPITYAPGGTAVVVAARVPSGTVLVAEAHAHPVGGAITAATAPHTHADTFATSPAGTGTAFSILPQYLAAFYIMRIK